MRRERANLGFSDTLDRAEAAAVIRECQDALSAKGRTILDEIAGGLGEVPDWRRYPDGEAYDPVSHAQYFYHRHASSRPGEGDEHGHFHLFLRAEGVPQGMAPLLWPELVIADAPVPRQSAPLKRGERDEVCHLIAIAIDRGGDPVRLFTTNRWVTGESWYAAADVIGMLERFHIEREEPSTLLNRWLGALVKLFEAQIGELLQERDEKVLGWRRLRRRSNVFEDLRLEITSSRDIDLAAQLAAAERRSADAARSFAHRPVQSLPRMAEGWGV